jgi:hypothetical protein
MSDHSWTSYCYGLRLPLSASCVSNISAILSSGDFSTLLNIVKTYHLCSGNPEQKYISLCKDKKEKIMSSSGNINAFLHTTGDYFESVRHVNCEVLVKENGQRCSVCHKYRNTLRAMYSRSLNVLTTSTPHRKANIRYLHTPQQKRRILSLKKRVAKVSAQNRRLSEKINKFMTSSTVKTDSGLESVLLATIDKHQGEIDSLRQTDFKKLFWEQQVRLNILFCYESQILDICYESQRKEWC